MSILEFKNVSHIYHSQQGEVNAIDNLSFACQEGELIAIVGPSGCGKTTILSLISNLIKPTSGEIICKEKNDKGLNIGYMLQRDCLFEWRTIFKNCLLGLEIQKNVNDDSKAYVNNLLEKYGLLEFSNKYPQELSGGMRQRVALIRTLATSPKILLLDEPTSALDYQTRLNVSNDLHHIITSEKKTAILVTHDLSEAIAFADRIVVLTTRPARVLNIHNIDLKESTPLERRKNPEFSKYFDKIWGELNT